MLRNLALIGVCAGGLLVAGCRDDNNFTPTDFARMGDLGAGGGDSGGGGQDLSMMKMYMATTPNAIDTGTVAKNTAVKLTGMVVTTPVSKFFSKSSATCKYEVNVQDPACTTPPCGLVVDLNGPTLPVMDAGSSSCPLPASSGTSFSATMVGDVVDVTGVVDTFADKNNAAIIQHSIVGDSVTKTGGPMNITPMVVTDGSMFVVHVTGGFPMYEGTLITIQPSTKLQVTSFDTGTPYDFHTSPGNTSWGTTFHFAYKNGMDTDAGDFPQVGTMFTSITGVVNTIFGGSVEPRFNSDFVP
jgi:hypothetical protein